MTRASTLLRVGKDARLGAAIAVACALTAGCGPGPLEAFDVAIVAALECTRNASSQQCEDPEALAQQQVTGRWTFEHGANETFTLVDHEGRSVTGVTFPGTLETLDQVLPGHPCIPEEGLCYFGRRRFQSSDPDNNGCTRFGQFAVVLRRNLDGTFVGRTSDITGFDERCGTASVTERIEDITGALAPEPSRARSEDFQ